MSEEIYLNSINVNHYNLFRDFSILLPFENKAIWSPKICSFKNVWNKIDIVHYWILFNIKSLEVICKKYNIFNECPIDAFLKKNLISNLANLFVYFFCDFKD